MLLDALQSLKKLPPLQPYYKSILHRHGRASVCEEGTGELHQWNACGVCYVHVFLNRVQQTVSGNAPSQHLQTPLAGHCLGAF